MARYLTHPSARSLLGGAFVAGIIGGFLFDAFLFAVGMARFPATYQWIASGIIGRHLAYSGTDFVWLGIALHFGIAVVAAVTYAYVGQIVGLLGRPFLGGTILGVAMNAIMDTVVVLKGLAPVPHSVHDIGLGLAAHVLFYGIPVAWFISRYERIPIPY